MIHLDIRSPGRLISILELDVNGLFFCNLPHEAHSFLLGIIENRFFHKGLNVCGTQLELMECLHKSRPQLDVSIVAAADEKTLAELISVRHLFEGIPLILVLPELEAPAFARKYELYPRYIADLRDGFQDGVLVLDKIMKNHESLKSDAGPVAPG